MKKKISTIVLLSVFAGSLLLASSGCSKKAVIPPESSAGAGGSNINYPAAEGGYNENALPAEGTLDDASAKGGIGDEMAQSDEYKRVHGRCSEGFSPIYFDFDQAGVRSDMEPRMVQNGQFLEQNASTMVVVEGNSDERGTNEYNLALGERRAQNAKQFLIGLGIAENRIRTLSYGEEKPLFDGQDEDSFAQNRRVDFVAE